MNLLFQWREGATRLAVGVVLALNVSCALAFILQPGLYVHGFELSGVPGQVAVRGMGILFLMWNVPYAWLLVQPRLDRSLFAIVLIQQSLGVVGETWMYLMLPGDHAALRATGLRFILFDAGGLVVMLAGFLLYFQPLRQE